MSTEPNTTPSLTLTQIEFLNKWHRLVELGMTDIKKAQRDEMRALIKKLMTLVADRSFIVPEEAFHQLHPDFRRALAFATLSLTTGTLKKHGG